MSEQRMSKEQRANRLGYWYAKRRMLGDRTSDEAISDLEAFAASHDAADAEIVSLKAKIARYEQALYRLAWEEATVSPNQEEESHG